MSSGVAAHDVMIRRVAILGWVGMFCAYSSVFILFGANGVVEGMQRALFNTLPAALLSWPIVRLVERSLVGTSWLRQAAGHFCLALGFAFVWYIGIQIGYGLQNGLPEGGIIGRALIGVALFWQMFQGVTLYAVIALFAYVGAYRRQISELEAERDALIATSQKGGFADAPRQIFVKDGRKMVPVSLFDIIQLSGAGDYTEVITRDGTYLSNTSLSVFEAELRSDRFLRVHRSHLVQVDAVKEIESGSNGRLILHLPDGQSVTTSRAGAKLVRDRAL